MSEELLLMALARSPHRFEASVRLDADCFVCSHPILEGTFFISTRENALGCPVAHEGCVVSLQTLLHERFLQVRAEEQPVMLAPPPPRKKPVDYLTVEQRFRLDEACRVFKEAFEPYGYGIMLVGSVMERPDFRDVDVRAILADEDFAQLYPNCDPKNPARDTYWMLTMAAYSLYLRESTGLPVDFQVQQMTAANEEFPGAGKRNAIGLGHARSRSDSHPEKPKWSDGV